MAEVDMMGDAPVGAILPFFGKVPKSFVDAGWLVCDGRALPRSAYPDLFAAIGQAFGFTSKEEDFCLPDLRGVFLRTVDANAGRDKGVKERVGSGPNNTGNAGDLIGSIEFGATRLPRDKESPFAIKGRLQINGVWTHGGCDGGQRIRYDQTATPVAFDVTSGDAESRPVNLCAIYLIKAEPNNKKDPTIGEVPVGAGICLPFTPAEGVSQHWLYCNGDTFIATGGSFYRLYEMLGIANGGIKDGPGVVQDFAVPDLRGLFVRGVAGDREDARFDPDRARRLTPRPDLTTAEGNSGNLVGSYEAWATAAPGAPAFSVDVKSYPFVAITDYQAGAANAAEFRRGESTTFDVVGGDAETRPISMSVRWYVRFRASRAGDELPLGTVIAAGTAAELAKWLPCHGEELKIKQYEALYGILGTKFGGDGKTTFCLPDLRGRFLRGVGDSSATYPRPRGAPAAEPGTTQDDTTGPPERKFTVSLANWPGDHTSNVMNHGYGSGMLRLGGEETIEASGSDAETRPINVYVRHLIKVLP